MAGSVSLICVFAVLCAAVAPGQSLTEMTVVERHGDLVVVGLQSQADAPGNLDSVRDARPWEMRPWVEKDCQWLFFRGGGSHSNWDDPPAAEGEPARWEVQPKGVDTWLAGVDLEPWTETLNSVEFIEFMRTHGLEGGVRSGAEREVTVRRLESHKLLLRAAAAGDQPGGSAMSKTGQRAELRPAADPMAVPPGAVIPLRLYLPEGYPKRQKLIARHAASGARLSFESDGEGMARVVLDRAGEWSLTAHALRAPTKRDSAKRDPANKDQVDWELCSASLVFITPPTLVLPNELPKQTQGDQR